MKYPSLPLCGEEGAKGNKELLHGFKKGGRIGIQAPAKKEYNLHFIKAVEKKTQQ